MICYKCYRERGLMYKTACTDTRTYEDEADKSFWVERRHMCTNCGHKFKTREVLSED